MGELLPRLERTRREVARLQAEEAALLAEAQLIADDWAAEEAPDSTSAADFPHRSVAAEIAAAWRVSDRTVQRQLADAAALVNDFPETHAALSSGDISGAHARVIVTCGDVIERPELRAEYEASVLDYAKAQSATRLAPIAKRRAEWFAESTIEERHRRARDQRRVWVTDLDDGMSEVALCCLRWSHTASTTGSPSSATRSRARTRTPRWTQTRRRTPARRATHGRSMRGGRTSSPTCSWPPTPSRT